MAQSNTPVCPRPFLRWAGSKRQLVPRLREFWTPEFRRYVEPFAGSSALFFAIRPARAFLADKNTELIESYEVIREYPVELYDAVTSIPRDEQTYYKLRDQNPAVLSRFDRVVRFVYLNRYCFNGLYRTNSQGAFNVPYSPYGTGTFPSVEYFIACADALRGVALRAWDFGKTLRCVRDGDFVYMDPHYAVSSRRVFREYGASSFASRDLLRLSKHLRRIHERGARFLLTYADCSEARKVFACWSKKRIRVRRNIAGFANARRNAFELLVFN